MKDSHLRSILKGISWRIVGTADTITIALLVTGHIGKALTIGATEVITKILLFYLHERIWQYFASDKMYSSRWSIAKAFTWRITGTLDTIMLSLIIISLGSETANDHSPLVQASTIGMIELGTKMVLYYLHERVWNRISFGRVQTSKVEH